ncbi:MAG: hypothetical protein VB858_22495 [Planctomycetaceae bacterium]
MTIVLDCTIEKTKKNDGGCTRDIRCGEVGSSPTRTLLMDKQDKTRFDRFNDLAGGKRPTE